MASSVWGWSADESLYPSFCISTLLVNPARVLMPYGSAGAACCITWSAGSPPPPPPAAPHRSHAFWVRGRLTSPPHCHARVVVAHVRQEDSGFWITFVSCGINSPSVQVSQGGVITCRYFGTREVIDWKGEKKKILWWHSCLLERLSLR